ncbi:MAG: 1-deoxy-D-xylulose-5-phosphate synthase [Thermotogota bacterium]
MEQPYYKEIRKMNYAQLYEFADEIRKYIYDVVYSNNGHLASNFGVVELTLALYRVFDPYEDVVIWDTSHQAYVHKLLTNRWNDFKTLRSYDGISGFTNIFESEADKFGAGHAGTSISAALGYALADKITKKDRNVLSIIGDGSFTCGMALESLNQLKYQKTNVKIILNSNDMAISPNVGTLSTLFSKIRMKKNYNSLKKFVKDILGDSELGHDLENMIKQMKEGLKHTVYSEPVGFFEDLGIKYIGPIDGHNIKEVELFLNYLKQYDEGPVVLHVLTTKGKGYINAENEPSKFHGVSKPMENLGVSNSKIVGNVLSHISNENFLAFTGAMAAGTGLNILKDKAPEKLIDMGITEASIVTAAASLSLGGILPVVDLYSTFMQRAFDSIIHDVALQKIPSLFLLDRAGLVGEDGPTHHGVFDISYLKLIPNIELITPLDGQDLANILYTSVKKGLSKPTFIRFPKENYEKNIDEIISDLEFVDIKWKKLKNSLNEAYVLTVGSMSKNVLKATEDIDINVIGVRTIKEMDQEIINELKTKSSTIITVEEGSLSGGFNESIYKMFKDKNVYSLGIEDKFIPHGSRQKQLEICGLDTKSLKQSITKIINNNKRVV